LSLSARETVGSLGGGRVSCNSQNTSTRDTISLVI
jgi:hypothetical protein